MAKQKRPKKKKTAIKQKRTSAQALSKELLRKLEYRGIKPVLVRLTGRSANKDVQEFFEKLDRFEKASRKAVVIIR